MMVSAACVNILYRAYVRGKFGCRVAAGWHNGLDMAVAREGTAVALTPLYTSRGVPPDVLPAAYIYAAYIVLGGTNSALSNYLWMVGRVAAMAKGELIRSLSFRAAEVSLIYALKDVRAIPLAMAAGQAAALAYYLAVSERPPSLARGLRLLRAGLARYLRLGLQQWALAYIGAAANAAVTYIIYELLGPRPAALYGAAAYMAGLTGSFASAVTSVFGSRAARSANPEAVLRDYLRASTFTAALLAQAAVTAPPLFILLGIVRGDYGDAVPYGAVLMAAAVPGTAASLYAFYHWTAGRGARAVAVSAASALVAIAATAIIAAAAHTLYAAVAAAYLSSFAALAMYAPRQLPIIAALTALPAATALLLPAWPAPQLAALAVLAAAAYRAKPIPSAAARQLAAPLRALLTPFIK
jgi:O-antigen/teichoic acid export membrane protein